MRHKKKAKQALSLFSYYLSYQINGLIKNLISLLRRLPWRWPRNRCYWCLIQQRTYVN